MLIIEFIDSEIVNAIIILMLAFTLFIFSLKKESRALVTFWEKGVYLFFSLVPFIMAAMAMRSAEDSISKFHQGERFFAQ